MVDLMSLWLPILMSAVVVFLVSSILHMLLPYHRSDFRGVPDQDRVREALQPFTIPPGDYMLPHAESLKESGSPEFVAKLKAGPVIMMTVLPSAPFTMAGPLALWFVYLLLVALFCGYVVGGLLGPGADYLTVHRYVGAAAFMGYGLALLQGTIWYKRKWSSTLKSVGDALIYALCTGGVFGWLWPAA